MKTTTVEGDSDCAALMGVRRESQELAKKIIGLYVSDSTEKILFLCVGASAAYIYNFGLKDFQKNGTRHQRSCLLPISGLSVIYEENYMKVPLNGKAAHQMFRKYVSRYIGNESWGKIVFIDHSHTGKSITNLIRLFKEIGINPHLGFINLVDNKTPLSLIKSDFIKKSVQDYHILQGDYINAISGHEFSRLSPQVHLCQILNGSNKKTRRNSPLGSECLRSGGIGDVTPYCSKFLHQSRQSFFAEKSAYLSDHRHDNPDAQIQYDRNFGIVPSPLVN